MLVLSPTWVSAHKPSDSYLTLTLEESKIQGKWDMALRDLEHAIGLDADQDGAITWGEVRAGHGRIAAYARSRLEISQQGIPCETHPDQHLVDHHSDGTYAVLTFSITCPRTTSVLQIEYNLFFDLDQLHRGLLRVEEEGRTQTFVFHPQNRTFSLNLAIPSFWATFQQFGVEGIWHIWTGYDHLLFLLSLLLPAVLVWENGQWKAMPSWGFAFWEVVKIVTAFTLAHSLTLVLAVFQLVSLPSRWVEVAIAASVLAVALHNLFPFIHKRIWLMAFGFGLVHGLGFASVLKDLGLAGSSFLSSLGGFNVGVELGQLAIVTPILLLTFGVRENWWYQTLFLRLGSCLIAMVALVWLWERSLNWPILP